MGGVPFSLPAWIPWEATITTLNSTTITTITTITARAMAYLQQDMTQWSKFCVDNAPNRSRKAGGCC